MNNIVSLRVTGTEPYGIAKMGIGLYVTFMQIYSLIDSAAITLKRNKSTGVVTPLYNKCVGIG